MFIKTLCIIIIVWLIKDILKNALRDYRSRKGDRNAK